MTRPHPAPAPSVRPEANRPSGVALEVLFTAISGLHPGLGPIEALIDRIEARP